MEIAELLFRRAGYTVERMLEGYAEIGMTHLGPSSYFPTVREPLSERWNYELIGASGITVSDVVTDAVETVYQYGLIDVEETENGGVVDLTERLSCGQSLHYAYQLVCSMMPAE